MTPRTRGIPECEAARLRFNFSDLVRQKDEVISYYRDKKYQSIVGDRISVLEGSVRFVERNAVQVGDVRLEADRFLIATGSQPFIPSLEGLDKIPFLTSDLLTSQEDVESQGAARIAHDRRRRLHRFGTRSVLQPARNARDNH